MSLVGFSKFTAHLYFQQTHWFKVSVIWNSFRIFENDSQTNAEKGCNRFCCFYNLTFTTLLKLNLNLLHLQYQFVDSAQTVWSSCFVAQDKKDYKR